MLDAPWVLGADFNCTPQELRDTGWPKLVDGVIKASRHLALAQDECGVILHLLHLHTWNSLDHQHQQQQPLHRHRDTHRQTHTSSHITIACISGTNNYLFIKHLSHLQPCYTHQPPAHSPSLQRPTPESSTLPTSLGVLKHYLFSRGACGPNLKHSLLSQPRRAVRPTLAWESCPNLNLKC